MKTSKKDFELFKQECQKWIDYFGLKDWYVIYKHDYCTLERANAEFYANSQDCVIEIILGKDVSDNYNVSVCAFHEVVEGMLLGRLSSLTDSRFNVTPNVVEKEMHHIVRVLENTILKDVKP